MDEIIKNIIVTVLVLFVMRLITFGAERKRNNVQGGGGCKTGFQ